MAAALLGLIFAGPAAAQEPAPPPGTPPPAVPLPAPPAPVPDSPTTIFVPPPTVPSTAAPIFLPPRDPGLPPPTTLRLGFSVAATGQYTDNFFLSDADKTDNFRSALSPGISLDINSPFTTGRIGYSLSATHDTVSPDDDVQFFHSLLGLISWEATPLLRLTLSTALSRSDEPTQADRLALRRERGTFTAYTLSASADYRVGRLATTGYYRLSTFLDRADDNVIAHTIGATAGTSFYENNSGSLGYEYLTSESEGQEDASSTISGHRFTASFSRQISRLTTAGITGSYATRRTEGGPTALGADRRYDLWSVAVFNAYTTERLSLASSLGYSQTLPDTGGSDSSVTTITSLSYRFARATATIAVDSGFSETFAEGQNFGVVETRGVTGTLSVPITPLLSGTASAFYRQNDRTGLGQTASGGLETTWGTTVGFGFRLTRWLGLSLDYGHTEATSSRRRVAQDAAGRGDYTENRASITLSAAF